MRQGGRGKGGRNGHAIHSRIRRARGGVERGAGYKLRASVCARGMAIIVHREEFRLDERIATSRGGSYEGCMRECVFVCAEFTS